MTWRKSTKCEQGMCVEVQFTKSTRCEGGNCVEVCRDDMVAVRNSQVPGEVIWFDHDEWRAFIAGVKLGEFDL